MTEKMSPKTRKALEGSIEKWEGIVRSTKAEEKGIANCPLCQLFFNPYCFGCPVKEKTGMYGCQGSPYNAWDNHHETLHRNGFGEVVSRHKDCPDCLRLAKKELEFLKELLPEKKKEG